MSNGDRRRQMGERADRTLLSHWPFTVLIFFWGTLAVWSGVQITLTERAWAWLPLVILSIFGLLTTAYVAWRESRGIGYRQGYLDGLSKEDGDA